MLISRDPNLLSSLYRWTLTAVLPVSFLLAQQATGANFTSYDAALLLVISLISWYSLHALRVGVAGTGLGRPLFAWGLALALVFLLGDLSRLEDYYDQSTVRAWVVMSLAMTVGLPLFARGVVARLGKAHFRRVVIVGESEEGSRVCAEFANNAFLLTTVTHRLAASEAESVLGPLLRAGEVDAIYTAGPLRASEVQAISRLTQDSTATVCIIPDLSGLAAIRPSTHLVGGVPVVTVLDTPFHGVAGLTKRGFDLVAGLAALLALSPLLAVLAVLVKLDSHGPALFKQRRYGLNGEVILVYKFRSMTVAEDGADVKQATRGDSRVTRLGRILRKSSLDELPQLINVVQGRMSLVGPRPHAVAHNELYRGLIPGYMLRHKVRPGITGWAQVNGFRGETDTLDKMEGRVAYDLEYLRSWSLPFDLYIMAKTVTEVIRVARHDEAF